MAFVLFSGLAFGQSMHVTSVHKATRETEKTYRTAFSQMIVEGNIGNRHYTLEGLDTWGSYHFEVGQDYVVDKADGSSVKVEVPGGKKGKQRTETLNVFTVEEVQGK